MDSSKILFVCKLSKIENDKMLYGCSTKKLIDYYDKMDFEYNTVLYSHIEQKMTIHSVKKLFPNSTFIITKDLSKDITINKDIVVSIGGDEHFKYVVHNSYDRLTYSIRSDNLKSEGQLSCCNRFTIGDMAENLLSNNYSIYKWTRLECKINGKPIESPIDTIFVGSKYCPKISRYILKYKGREEEQKSSGMLIATGAGSTGWYTSVGGKAFDRTEPMAKFIVREVYRGTKTRYSLVEGKITKGETIEITSLMDESIGCIDIDAVKQYTFKRGTKLSVGISEVSLNVLDFSL